MANPNDSVNSSFRFAPVDQFTPNSNVGWARIGNVTACVFDAPTNSFTITGSPPNTGIPGPAPILKIFLLGPASFRLRFNPAGDYVQDGSFAVVNRNLGQFTSAILQNDVNLLSVQLKDANGVAGLRLDIKKQPFTVQVFFKGLLISQDTPDQGLIYIPGASRFGQAVANFKSYPANANYFGFGEKGGNTLRKNENSMTTFNYDNFQYNGSNTNTTDQNGNLILPVVPGFSSPGPLNSAEPLYNSVPFLIEDNPNPLDGSGNPTNIPYSYGLFLDNESQTYFNLGQSSSYAGNMYGKYYFGALYGEIDYYFMAGNNTAEVLQQFNTLTGPAALVPMWVLGYHQGCYGYFDHTLVIGAVNSYRLANIPLDGIHVDVDFQNNYRTFTISPEKFPANAADMFAAVHAQGVKVSTNITGIVSMVTTDETGAVAPYSVFNDGVAKDVFIKDVRAEDVINGAVPAAPGYFVVNEYYGTDTINPFQPAGSQLSTYGHYADLGKQANRVWWGGNYAPLLAAGLDMVWQDMTDPATQISVSDSMPFKTLALNLMVYDETSASMVPHARIHNVYSLNLVKATYDGLLQLQPAKRPFIISRGGYAGIQRYAASWTGDSASDWEFLGCLIPELLNFGLSGQPLSGADVGGFATSRVGGPLNGTGAYGITNSDLLTRWTTLSAFIGWFRNHYDGYTKAFQEPYAYGEPVASYCRNYIEIRYKLLQYFYDALYECTQTGLPICRPLFLTDREDINVYSQMIDGQSVLDTQFMVGQNILVAPVVKPNQYSRAVYLPAGSSWFAFTDNKAPLQGPSAGGGQPITWWVPINLVPVYIRAGAIIPHRELEQFVGQLPVNPLTFDIYPGPASTHQLYLDDKVSTQAQTNKVYRLTQISQSLAVGANRVQTVSVVRAYDNFLPNEPFYFVGMLQTAPPLSVTVNGAILPILQGASDQDGANQLAASAVNACYYNQSLNTTFVKVFDTNANTTIVGTFPL